MGARVCGFGGRAPNRRRSADCYRLAVRSVDDSRFVARVWVDGWRDGSRRGPGLGRVAAVGGGGEADGSVFLRDDSHASAVHDHMVVVPAQGFQPVGVVGAAVGPGDNMVGL